MSHFNIELTQYLTSIWRKLIFYMHSKFMFVVASLAWRQSYLLIDIRLWTRFITSKSVNTFASVTWIVSLPFFFSPSPFFICIHYLATHPSNMSFQTQISIIKADLALIFVPLISLVQSSCAIFVIDLIITHQLLKHNHIVNILYELLMNLAFINLIHFWYILTTQVGFIKT